MEKSFWDRIKHLPRRIGKIIPWTECVYFFCIVMIYLIILGLFMSYHTAIQQIVNDSFVNLIVALCEVYKGSKLINISILGLFLCGGVFVVKGLSNFDFLREWRILLELLALGLMDIFLVNDQVQNASWLFCGFFCLLMVLLASLCVDFIRLLSECGHKFVYRKKECYERDDKYAGFVTDIPVIQPFLETELPSKYRESTARSSYAKSLAHKLLQTDTHEESFSVNISGEWGSGKTTFMKSMVNYLKKQAHRTIIVDFHPWNCRSVVQIETQFIETLQKSLHSYDILLSKALKKYALLLAEAVGVNHSSLGHIIKGASTLSSSIEEQKEKVSNQMGRLSKKVFVFIDDVDRLEEDELYATIMLLRNTANFKNLIYIVALDKEYVLGKLQKKLDFVEDKKHNDVKMDNGRIRAAAYLEKMFQLEITLPKINTENIISSLERDLSDMLKHKSSVKMSDLYHSINANKDLLLIYLTNYRKAKRFARNVANSVEYFAQMDLIEEISINDLLLVELLKCCDPFIYKQLTETPDELVSLKRDYYEVKKESSQSPILLILFSERNKDEMSIRYKMNFDNYFYLHTSKDVLSVVEFQYMVNEAVKFSWSHIPNIIQQCIDEKKQIETITYRFEHFVCREKNKQQVNGYLNLLAYWICSCHDEGLNFEKLTSLINADRFTKSRKELKEYSDYFLQAFMDILQQDKEFEYLKIARIFTPVYNFEPEDETYQHLLNNQQVKNILHTLFNAAYPDYTASDILTPESFIYRYITQTNRCLNKNTKRNPIWDVILPKLKGQKNNISDLDSLISTEQFVYYDDDNYGNRSPKEDLFLKDNDLINEFEAANMVSNVQSNYKRSRSNTPYL